RLTPRGTAGTPRDTGGATTPRQGPRAPASPRTAPRRARHRRLAAPRHRLRRCTPSGSRELPLPPVAGRRDCSGAGQKHQNVGPAGITPAAQDRRTLSPMTHGFWERTTLLGIPVALVAIWLLTALVMSPLTGALLVFLVAVAVAAVVFYRRR